MLDGYKTCVLKLLNMDYKLLSFVLRSKKRKAIVASLSVSKTPTEIASEVGVSVSHVSRTLKEFVGKGIVELKTPNERVGRIYELTKEGKDILKHIKS